MEKQSVPLKAPIARQTSRYGKDTRRPFVVSSHRLMEHQQQLNTKQASSKSKVSDYVSCYSQYYSMYEEIAGKSSKSNEAPDSSRVVFSICGPPNEYSKDFATLLNNPIFSDVEIKCGEETIKAHKNVLASRSPVFNAMFNHSMVESATGVVSITDLDSQVIRDLLTFIYCNKVQNFSLVKACGLLEAATKYQVQTLKEMCVAYLVVNMTQEHALIILQKGDLYDVKLKRIIMSYVSEKFFDIRGTEDWIKLQKYNPVLALEVCNMVLDKMEKQ